MGNVCSLKLYILNYIPIELTKFSVEKANFADTHIEWATANESNTAKYDIERSADGKHFVKIGEVKAVGHSHESTRYDFLDKNLPFPVTNIFYYRLKIFDLDGTSTLTETRSISFDTIGKNLVADIFPTPSHSNKCRLILRGGIQEDILTEISVNDMYGRQRIQVLERLRLDSALELDLGAAATTGVYFVTIKNGLNRIVQKLVIQ